MTNEIQNNTQIRIEPVAVYQCPLCGHDEIDYDKAIKHANKPVIELPKGLVYRDRDQTKFYIVYDTSGCDQYHYARHALVYLTESSDHPQYCRNIENAYSLLDLLRYRERFLLSEGEFNRFVETHPKTSEFLQKNGIPSLVRTTLELEEMLRGGSGQ